MLLASVVLGGCTEPEEDDKKETLAKKAEKLPDLESRDIVNRPLIGDPTLDRQLPLIKPGHQMSLGMSMRANLADGRGTLQWQFIESDGRPLPFTSAAATVAHDRSVTLPKKQLRQVELPVLVPAVAAKQVQVEFRPTSLGLGGFNKTQNFQLMRSQQYQMLVLAGDPLDYRYLSQLTAVKFPGNDLEGDLNREHYVVVLPNHDQLTFPRGLLHWTTFAYVVWDDFDPSKLEADEQQALIDWLHWGGQLIISGPDTLTTLGESFLRPYLPALGTETTTLDSAALKPLNTAAWTNSGLPRLTTLKPWSGVKLEPQPDAAPLMDAQLIVERRVGRGRIVVTAFRLDQRELREWPGRDGLWHSCLLRRAPRRFESIGGEHDNYSVHWRNLPDKDSAPITDLRLFARDAGYKFTKPETPPEVFNTFRQRPTYGPLGAEPDVYESMGSWRDVNSVVKAATETLGEAAGIVVPERAFVTRLLGIYLVLLVPANWLLFRLMRRVEWAWVAVPVLAITFAGVVTHLAEVNVGFARARTEVNVVELHANHPRAHVARFNALYSSLGTAYELLAEGADSLAMPLVNTNAPNRSQVELRVEPIALPHGEGFVPGTRTRGFVVSSNATGLMRMEHVHEFGMIGFRRLDANRYEVANLTARPFTGGVMGPEGRAWLGTVPAGEKTVFTLSAETVPWFGAPSSEGTESTSNQLQGIDLSRHIELAIADREPQELRLIALCAGELDGVTITPAAAQRRTATLLVVHLDFGAFNALSFDSDYRAPMTAKSDD